MTHAQLVTAAYNLLESLRLSGKPVVCSKTATVQAKLATGRWIDTGRPGWPDLTAGINGSLVMIECKVGRDPQRDDQIAMQAACEAAGGVYLVCRDTCAVLRVFLQTNKII